MDIFGRAEEINERESSMYRDAMRNISQIKDCTTNEEKEKLIKSFFHICFKNGSIRDVWQEYLPDKLQNQLIGSESAIVYTRADNAEYDLTGDRINFVIDGNSFLGFSVPALMNMVEQNELM